MSETKHTPTPWHFNSSLWIYASSGLGVCEMSFDTYAQAEANAAFIVRAVNSYDAMREALEDAIGGMNKAIEVYATAFDAGWAQGRMGTRPDTTGTTAIQYEAMALEIIASIKARAERARAALALAKGK